jgi:hypothetical protein
MQGYLREAEQERLKRKVRDADARHPALRQFAAAWLSHRALSSAWRRQERNRANAGLGQASGGPDARRPYPVIGQPQGAKLRDRRSMEAPGGEIGLVFAAVSCLVAGFALLGYLNPRIRNVEEVLPDYALVR